VLHLFRIDLLLFSWLFILLGRGLLDLLFGLNVLFGLFVMLLVSVWLFLNLLIVLRLFLLLFKLLLLLRFVFFDVFDLYHAGAGVCVGSGALRTGQRVSFLALAGCLESSAQLGITLAKLSSSVVSPSTPVRDCCETRPH